MAHRFRARVLAVALCCLLPAVDARAESRADVALALAEPIARCVARRDTAHPAFHGCLDWHSSVHGTWALLAAARLGGNTRHAALIDGILAPEKIARERRDLAADPRFEMPYGRAWFLRLAVEDRAAGHDRLTGFAAELADSLVAFYRARPPDPSSRDYDSASWALINLYDYGLAAGRDDIVQFVRRAVHAHFLPATEPCDPARELHGGFMAICSNWAWLVSRVLPPAEFAPWLARFLPAPEKLVPVAQPRGAHQHGLNFSRAWGLAGLYGATGDARWRRAYFAHFELAYRNRHWWDGDYRAVGHWVAQFGMFALQQDAAAERK